MPEAATEAVHTDERELEYDDEHQVTPLELFFDLVFVFALTQVTVLLADDPTWGGVLRGMLTLAALWWAWSVYAWLTSAMDVDEGGVRLAMLAAMTAMFGVALAVPGAFGDDAVLFGVAYLLVRLLHLVLSTIVVRDDPERLGALLRFAPTAILGPSLLLVAGFLGERAHRGLARRTDDRLPRPGRDRRRAWVACRARALRGAARADHSHRARRVDHRHRTRCRLRARPGSHRGLASRNRGRLGALVALLRRGRDLREAPLVQAHGLELHRLALYAYSYLHLPMAAGIVLFALGLKTTVADVGESLDAVPAVALCGGAALYLVGHIAFLFRTTGRVFRRRTIGATALLALIPLALVIPALAALALVSAVCAFVVAYEAIRHREHRVQVRHPEIAR